jgi:hypothetical protein
MRECQAAFYQKKPAHLLSLWHHRSHPTQLSTSPAQKSKVQKELPTRATSDTLPSTAHQAPRHQQRFVPANQSGTPKKIKSRRYKRKPQKPNRSHGYEGLLSLIHGMLRSMANMDMTRKPSPWVKQVWVKKDETTHPLKGS